MKRVKFRKRKQHISPEVGAKVHGALMQMLLVLAELRQGRVNISPLFSNAAKEAAYEAGFPGFVVQLPRPKPKPRLQIDFSEYVLNRNETILEKRLREIRARQAAETDQVSANTAGEILEILRGPNEAGSTGYVAANVEGRDSRPDSG